ncbi:MAG: methyltransferase [Bacteriovoracaceae bacterium]|nr:methyltransferase [Bacteriovoracaceae bacterium]
MINHYPGTLNYYPNEWIGPLKQMNTKQLWHFECNLQKITYKHHQFISTAKKITKLKKLAPIPEYAIKSLPSWALINVKAKKQHEIERLSQLINELKATYQFEELVDIGGGVGHLARTMAHYYDLPCTCIEQNPDLIKSGTKRLKKFPLPPDAKSVNFTNMSFGADTATSQKQITKLFKQHSLTIGLHTCGNLSVKHINATLEHSCTGLINFGCCYLKMNPREVNISNFAQNSPLIFTDHALNLATRSHSPMDFDQFLLKKRVKYYRYAFHLLLYYKFNKKQFIGVGSSKPSLYWQDFGTYAMDLFDRIKMKNHLSKKQLNLFYDDRKTLRLIHHLFVCNMIRWQFGNVLEHYILTDRALYLEEHGHKTTMLECFDEHISPRNIAICSVKSI